jgi:hypothetical protein
MMAVSFRTAVRGHELARIFRFDQGFQIREWLVRSWTWFGGSEGLRLPALLGKETLMFILVAVGA